MNDDDWQTEMMRAEQQELWEVQRLRFGWAIVAICVAAAAFFGLWVYSLL